MSCPYMSQFMDDGKHLSGLIISIINEHERSHSVNQDESPTFFNRNFSMAVVFNHSIKYCNNSLILNMQDKMILSFSPRIELTCPVFRSTKGSSYVYNNFTYILH